MRLHSFDTETHLSQPGLAAPPIVCGSVGDDLGAHLLDLAESLNWLRERLANPDDHLVGCNIVYDLGCAAAADPALLPVIFNALDAGRIHDVGIREALIDIHRGTLIERGEDEIGIRYGMRILVERYLPEEAAKTQEDKKGPDAWRKRYADLENIPIEQWPWAARVYPLRDAAFPLAIYHAQEGGPNLVDEANQVRAAFALHLMSIWGLRSDPAAVAKLRERVEAADRKCQIDFQASGILRPDGTEDQKRKAEHVTAAYAGQPPQTPTGRVAGDRDTLAESGNPLLELYATAGKNDKYLSTYLPILEQGIAQPWNPQFNVLVATTRVSSNAQQFPQNGGVRECWTARTRALHQALIDYVYCSVDYGGLELRTMSQRALWQVGYSLMAEALNGGRDCHVIAAASFNASTYDQTLALYKVGDDLAKAFRDLGKVWNFGKGGGAGPAAMVYAARKGAKGETTTGPDGHVYVGVRFCILTKQAGANGICGEYRVTAKVQGVDRRICQRCLNVARQLDDGWLRAWPEQKALFELASKLSEGNSALESSIKMSNVTRGRCGYTQWLNDPFQKLGAVATKRAMWLASREMHTRPESPMWGSHLVLNVHDELIAEMPEDRAPEAGDRLAFIMRETLKHFVPDLARSVEAEPALSRTMSKGAKTIRDDAGRLQVWELKQIACS